MAVGLKRWFPFKENETKSFKNGFSSTNFDFKSFKNDFSCRNFDFKSFKNGFSCRNFDFKSFKNDFSSRETTSCLFKAIPAQGNGLKTHFENPLFGIWLYNRVKWIFLQGIRFYSLAKGIPCRKELFV